MSSPNPGKNSDAPSAVSSNNEGQPDSASTAEAIKREAHNSLFLDSIPPNFRLPSVSLDDPPATPEAPKHSPEATGPDAKSAAPHKNGTDALPSKIFAENEDDRLTQEYIARRPGDEPYTVPRIGDDKTFQLNDRFLQQDQRMADRAEDFIYPGFGRFQGKGLGPFSGLEDWRLDYLYGKPCRIKGPSLCFSIRVH